MTASHDTAGTAGSDEPLNQFSQCHTGILRQLHVLGELPALAQAAAQARQNADETLRFFRDVIYEHHAEEEKELFPAVLASANAGEEQDRVREIVERLTREHREVEATWSRLERELGHVAKGRSAELDAAAVEDLVRRYEAHASFEETVFLPLSQSILGRSDDHMAALGLSLHIRHALPEVLSRFKGRV